MLKVSAYYHQMNERQKIECGSEVLCSDIFEKHFSNVPATQQYNATHFNNWTEQAENV